MLRIDKFEAGQSVVFRISGRVQAGDLHEVRAQFDGCTQQLALHLEELELVDREAVRFLGACEANGIELVSCPLYIREWIIRENKS